MIAYRCRQCDSTFTGLGGSCPICPPSWRRSGKFDATTEPPHGPGVKLDQDKDPWHLMPWVGARAVVRVLAFGLKKYGVPHGWRHVENARDRYFSATLRHLVAWRDGQQNDVESGLPHLAHAAACVLFLLAPEEESGAS